jgi:hypothetical protein
MSTNRMAVMSGDNKHEIFRKQPTASSDIFYIVLCTPCSHLVAMAIQALTGMQPEASQCIARLPENRLKNNGSNVLPCEYILPLID